MFLSLLSERREMGASNCHPGFGCRIEPRSSRTGVMCATVCATTHPLVYRFDCICFDIQWAPLNGITLGPRETDSYKRLILISEQTKNTLGWKRLFGACQLRYI